MDIIDYLKNEIWFRVKPSKVHGVGLFAIRDIPKGTDILVEFEDASMYTFLVNKADMSDVPLSVRKLLEDYYTHGIEEQDVYLPPNYKYIHLSFMNHFDNPNGYIVWNSDGSQSFITTKVIKEGEEILEDYNKLYLESQED